MGNVVADKCRWIFLTMQPINLQYGSILDSVQKKKTVDHIDVLIF